MKPEWCAGPRNDAADAQGISDGLAQTKLFRDLEIDHGRGLVPANLDGIDDKLGAAQGIFALLHT
jgi:hypothetical protein